MNTNKEINQVKTKARKIFTPKRIKTAVAVLVVCAITAGGGSWYWHQQKKEQHLQAQQAQTRMIAYQASQRNMNIIDANQAESSIAASLGIDESAITFNSVALKDRSQKDDDNEHHKDKKHDIKQEKANKNDQSTTPDTQTSATAKPQAASDTPAQPAATPPAAPAAVAKDSFYPVYEVTCSANNIEYKFEVDAQTGQILKNRVKG